MSFIGDAVGGVFDALGMGPKAGQVNPKYNATGGHPGDYAYNAFVPTPVTIGQNPNGSMMNIPGTLDYDPNQGGSRVQKAPSGWFSPTFTQGSFGQVPQWLNNLAAQQQASHTGGASVNSPRSPLYSGGKYAEGGPVIGADGRQMMADGGAPVFYAPTNSFNAKANIASAAQGSASNASAAQSGFNAQAIKDNFVAQAIKNQFQATPQQSNYNVNAPTNAYQAGQADIDTSNYQNLINTAQGQSGGGAGPTQGTIQSMQGLGQTLQDQMAGRGPSLAQLQLQQALNQNASQSASMIGSQKGINAGLAARGIANQTAAANQGAVNQSAQIRAQEQLNATNAYQSLLNQIGQTQLGQQQAGTQALATAGGLQNQQGANQIQNLAQQQQLNQATAAQNASMNLSAQQSNQQQAMANAQLAQASQQINAQTAAQNADLANSAQQMNWGTAQLNANLANAAQEMNWQTSLSNAQMRTQVSMQNAQNQTNVSMGNAQMRTNVGLANQQSQNYAMGLNSQVAQGNQASQLATNNLNQNTAISQAGLNLQYQNMLAGIASQNASLANQAQGINAGIGINNANNQQAWGNGMLGMGAGLLSAAAFSDERLKTGIRRSKTKEALPGVPIATFKYKGHPGRYKGVIAQDVEKVRPDLVGQVGGVKVVHGSLAPRRQMAQGGSVDPMQIMNMVGGGAAGGNPMMQSFLKSYGLASMMQDRDKKKDDPYGIGIPDMSPTALIAQNAMAAPGTGGEFAAGGQVPGMTMPQGGMVPGVAPYPGRDTLKNDIVPIDATPGEIVLPLSVTQSDNPPQAAAAFVASLQKRGYATGGIVGELPSSFTDERKSLFRQLGELRKKERAFAKGGIVK